MQKTGGQWSDKIEKELQLALYKQMTNWKNTPIDRLVSGAQTGVYYRSNELMRGKRKTHRKNRNKIKIKKAVKQD